MTGSTWNRQPCDWGARSQTGGHSTAAFAAVAALWLLDRRLSAIAAVFALFEGFTRIYLGAHYPHDVLGAAL
ncbi:phosphatase PAP2 family protein [Streptomyces sp. NPDC056165]